jgi:hypothetical protein
MGSSHGLRWFLKIFAIVLSPAVLWFGGLWLYSQRPLPPLPQSTGRQISWSAAEWSHLQADGERCILANNVWNRGAAKRGFEQEIFEEELDGKTALGWRWRSPWQIWPTIAAYPEMICGNKPWDQPVGLYEGMPFHPSEKRITANYNVKLQATGTYNMAFSLWAVSALPPSPATIRAEIMIWIANGGQRPAGIRRGSVEVNGVVYDTYINEHQHDASGSNRNEWTYVAFVAQTPVLQGPLDLSRFLDTLEPLNILTPDTWITDVELGNEVADGSGIAEVQDFALHLAPQAPAPLPAATAKAEPVPAP